MGRYTSRKYSEKLISKMQNQMEVVIVAQGGGT